MDDDEVTGVDAMSPAAFAAVAREFGLVGFDFKSAADEPY